ncbi:MAG: MBL fold metallo-hydrolase [Deferribacteraceae bacterium]|jgi:phosphoribosyl 1,2-cyclic phosphodiesterase|nr:MBL fold metallo-hydrolase [Deferribacteraceae bacterium]
MNKPFTPLMDQGVLHILSSGSKGNCCCIETERELIFIDAGVGVRSLLRFIGDSGKSVDDAYFFITHEHGDHISGLHKFCQRFTPKIFASEGTVNSLNWKGIPRKCLTPISSGKLYGFPSFCISAFNTSHDAYEPFGYTLTVGESQYGILTDCGKVTKRLIDAISGVNTLILEANYDANMLENGPYEERLKKRIASSKGHLSNLDACNILARLSGGALRECHFGHVSETNNSYELLDQLAAFCQKSFGVKVDVLRQRTYYSYRGEQAAVGCIMDNERGDFL